MDQPSSTTNAGGAASAVMLAVWSGVNIFYFKARGIDLSPELVGFEGLVTGAAVYLANWLKVETTYLMTKRL